MIVAGPVVDDISRLKVIGWAGEHGAWFDPAYFSDEPCPICDVEEQNDEGV